MDEEESYKRAKKRVGELRGFYQHLIAVTRPLRK